MGRRWFFLLPSITTRKAPSPLTNTFHNSCHFHVGCGCGGLGRCRPCHTRLDCCNLPQYISLPIPRPSDNSNLPPSTGALQIIPWPQPRPRPCPCPFPWPPQNLGSSNIPPLPQVRQWTRIPVQGHQPYRIARGYRYRDEDEEEDEGIGLVVLSCWPDASSSSALSLATKKTVSAEIVLSDPGLGAKAGAGEGSRRRTTTKNMTTGGDYIIWRLVQSHHVFGDGRGIGMVFRSDFWKDF